VFPSVFCKYFLYFRDLIPTLPILLGLPIIQYLPYLPYLQYLLYLLYIQRFTTCFPCFSWFPTSHNCPDYSLGVLAIAIYLFCLPGSKWCYRLHNTQRQSDLQQGSSIELVALQYCARVPQRFVYTTCIQAPLKQADILLFPISYFLHFSYLDLPTFLQPRSYYVQLPTQSYVINYVDPTLPTYRCPCIATCT
jgi:hypothetical protein